MNYYVVGADGRQYGPADIATLRQWVTELRVVAVTELVDAQTGQRITAAAAPGLADLFGQPEAPAAPPPAPAGPVQGVPYPLHPQAGYTVPVMGENKSYLTAMVLAVLFGVFGVHRFYLGYTGTGVAQLCTCGGCGIWAFVDVVLLALNQLPDADGRPLKTW